MFKSIGLLEKATPLRAADSSTLPRVELVVAVDAAAGVVAVVAEEEVVEAAQALQRHRRSVQMRRFQSTHMPPKSRLSGGNIIGRPRNKLLLMDTILDNTHTLHLTPHSSLLPI